MLWLEGFLSFALRRLGLAIVRYGLEDKTLVGVSLELVECVMLTCLCMCMGFVLAVKIYVTSSGTHDVRGVRDNKSPMI